MLYVWLRGLLGFAVELESHRFMLVAEIRDGKVHVPVVVNGAIPAFGVINTVQLGVSKRHSELHPSALAVLPSSHCSALEPVTLYQMPVPIIPSPQRETESIQPVSVDQLLNH